MNVIQYSVENATVWDDEDFPTWQGHPTIPDVVYVDKHVQPSTDPCLANVILDGYGTLNATYLFQEAAARLQTGDTHCAVYDYAHRFMYVSNAQPYMGKNQPQLMAYERPFVRLNMQKLFAEEL